MHNANDKVTDIHDVHLFSDLFAVEIVKYSSCHLRLVPVATQVGWGLTG